MKFFSLLRVSIVSHAVTLHAFSVLRAWKLETLVVPIYMGGRVDLLIAAPLHHKHRGA